VRTKRGTSATMITMVHISPYYHKDQLECGPCRMANADLLIEELPDTTDLTCYFPMQDTDKHWHKCEQDKGGDKVGHKGGF
jgi:hypothetical protein